MNHQALLITLPVVVVLATLVYVVIRNIGRAWLDHRVKLALLEKFETRPDALGNLQALQEFVDGTQARRAEEQRQNLMLTGIFLAVIGVTCSLVAHAFFTGRYATGFYFGGVACVPIGFTLVLVGVILKLLNRRMGDKYEV